MLLALIVGVIGFVGACATTSPVDLVAGPTDDPAETESPSSETASDALEIEVLARPDLVPQEVPSLGFARVVLEHKARRKLDPEQRERVARILASAEREYGISVIHALAIIELESGFDPAARGPAGSIGLMQLQPATAREVAKRYGFHWTSDRTLLDPEQNARLGLAYLAELRRKFDTTEKAVAAYNIGPANLRRLLARRALRPGPYLTKFYAHVDALREDYER
jgi:soluble lytic murein transglycosylase-like protein